MADDNYVPPIVKQLGLESVDTTPPKELLTADEAVEEYKRLKKAAEFYALWLSYEMLMEKENRKYMRLQRMALKHPSLLEDGSKIATMMKETKFLYFKVSNEAKEKADASHKAACRFFDQHWRPLAEKKMTKPQEASRKMVKGEVMKGSELEEIIGIFRSQWRDLVIKLTECSR
jgi:hypothetical protein